jgi:predicted metal-dependent phosphoesterase TrpH
MSVDLHAHTTASDGSLTPTELVALASKVGLRAVGITDHDTIYGWDEALAASAHYGVEIIPGVELSTSYEGGRFHLLGYYIRSASRLLETLDTIQRARANRNGEIFENLQQLGVPLEETEVRAFAGEFGQLGRPHFARAMMARGYVASVQEAFDEYLADGKPAYATKAVLTPQEAIAQIHDAGGVAVWAHPPLNRNFTLSELEQKLTDWVSWGLDGLETYYTRYTPEETAWSREVVQKHGLLASGGSDFHGVSKPDINLGTAQDGMVVPDEVLLSLKQRRNQIRARHQ